MDAPSPAPDRPVRRDPHPPTPPDPTLGITLTPAASSRPRLLFGAAELPELRKRTRDPFGATLFRHLQQTVERQLREPVSSEPGAPLERGSAAGTAEAALLYLLCEERPFLEHAKAKLLALCARDGRTGDFFSAGHILPEVAWTYDWLHEHFTPAERGQILRFIRDLGTASARVMMTPLNYAGATPLHNITICAWSGIGIAGLGFHDELPQARVWAEAAARIFRSISWMQQPDGSGIEGPQYSAYGYERKTFYYEAARRCLGEDLYGPGTERAAGWLKHLTKPRMVGRNNAFPWADNGPCFDAHGPVYSLLALARRFQDPQAQRTAIELWEHGVGHQGGLGWINLLFYDPTLKPGSWESDPTAAHYEDMDLVAARSSWKDKATALSFLCGPYQGHRALRVFTGDPGGSHRHADTASFQVSSRGEDLLVDPGYEAIKYTRNHNTVLIDGLGQLGEGLKWFNVNRTLHWGGTAEILSFRDDGRAAAWVGEAQRMYLPQARLIRFHRHMLFLRPDLIVVLDDVRTEAPAVTTQLWHGLAPFTAMEGSRAFGLVRGAAALSLLPILPEGQPAESLSCRHTFDRLPDLSKFKDMPFSELRIEGPRTAKYLLATLIGIGDASAGPPALAARLVPPRLEISRGPAGPVSICFDLETQAPPRLA